MDFSFYNTVKISLLEPGLWKEKLLQATSISESVLFLYSKTAMNQADSDGSVINFLSSESQVTLITNIMSNPSVEHLAEIRKTLPSSFNTVIALGGGSVIDLAKIIIATNHLPRTLSSEKLLEIVKDKNYIAENPRECNFIAIPTTAGTGSELTRWATIWDKINKKKYSVEREDLYPSEAWIDPLLTAGMSEEITVSTGLDALSHAVEAYWSTKSNPIVRRLSAQSITLIVNNLPLVIESPENLEVRRKMCLGSVFAGLAFSQTRTTACHAISYALTAQFGIPHGIAVAMSLIPVMKLNWDSIEEQGLLLQAFGCNSITEIERVLYSSIGEKTSLDLKDYGIVRADLEKIFNDTDFLNDRLGNNPVKIPSTTFTDLIYEE